MSASESHSGVVLELAEEFLARYRAGERPALSRAGPPAAPVVCIPCKILYQSAGFLAFIEEDSKRRGEGEPCPENKCIRSSGTSAS
jgi:hypothetical protein